MLACGPALIRRPTSFGPPRQGRSAEAKGTGFPGSLRAGSALREYFVVHDDVRFILGCQSFNPGEDDALFTAMAERFEILGGPLGGG